MADHAGPRLARSAAARSAAGGACDGDEIEGLDVVEKRLQQLSAERARAQAGERANRRHAQPVRAASSATARRGSRRAPHGCSAPCAAVGRCTRAGRRCRRRQAPARAKAKAWNSQSAKRRDASAAAARPSSVRTSASGRSGSTACTPAVAAAVSDAGAMPALRTTRRRGPNSICPSGNQRAGLTSGSAGKVANAADDADDLALGAEDADAWHPARRPSESSGWPAHR